MKRKPTIIEVIKNPKLFGSLPRFTKLETWAAWLVVLKAIFGRESPPKISSFSTAILDAYHHHQINDHQLRSGTPAGLIIIISELSNIGQTPSCIPDDLDQTILETRDPSKFRRIKFFSVEESRVQERIYDYKHTPGAGFCFLIPDLVA